jgi:hypothetical protein
MLIPSNKATKFYIVAPANLATGGPELLHQLAFKLKRMGKKVSMLYLPNDVEHPIHKNYAHYDIDFVRVVEDNENNILISPETIPQLLEDYIHIKKVLWWLSVDNYFLWLPGIKGRINRLLLNRFGSQSYFFFNKGASSADFHLVQSEYANNYLIKKGIDGAIFLADYLNEFFLKEEIRIAQKENIVAYNPKKGMKFTRKLIQASPNVKFVAIENMSTDEVVALLQRAKVYIDFGFHPGKDRIPREAAALQCCVITNKRGSAGFSEDVPIASEFKFNENFEGISLVRDKITDCISNFDHNIGKFESYRDEIRRQESEFDSQVRLIFNG